MQKEWHRAAKTLVNTEIQKENQDDASKETQPLAKVLILLHTVEMCELSLLLIAYRTTRLYTVATDGIVVK
jgi:hypothetical protein